MNSAALVGQVERMTSPVLRRGEGAVLVVVRDASVQGTNCQQDAEKISCFLKGVFPYKTLHLLKDMLP